MMQEHFMLHLFAIEEVVDQRNLSQKFFHNEAVGGFLSHQRELGMTKFIEGIGFIFSCCGNRLQGLLSMRALKRCYVLVIRTKLYFLVVFGKFILLAAASVSVWVGSGSLVASSRCLVFIVDFFIIVIIRDRLEVSFSADNRITSFLQIFLDGPQMASFGRERLRELFFLLLLIFLSFFLCLVTVRVYLFVIILCFFVRIINICLAVELCSLVLLL